MNAPKPTNSSPAPARFALFVGGVAALLASGCCLGPLVLLLLGVSGAWIGNLTALEPYRPYFLSIAALALLFAWRGLGSGSGTCRAGEICGTLQAQKIHRVLFGVVGALVLLALSVPYVAPWFY
jgi:mercuric ion transport protein